MPKHTLIRSTSGIRGIVGAGLDPILVTQYAAAFGTMLKKGTVVIGADSRPSGAMFMQAVVAGLTSVGIDVVQVGIVPTPTVEIAVKKLKASGGICVTASHNPAPWNALKFFNDHGEFITPAQYDKLNKIFNGGKFAYKPADKLGRISAQSDWIEKHVKMTLSAKTVNRAAVKKRRFKIVIDAINGAGFLALPMLLRELGAQVIEINCKGDGDFVHEPEPTPANLGQLSRAVKKHKADLGMACDPDADRLALVDEKGRPIGEELTLTIAVQQVLSKIKGPTVINLSTSKVTADAAEAMGSKVHYSKVGEANVVQMMHRRKGVIGGEGNGGVIFPSFHAGRDALIAAALVLSRLAGQKITLSGLVETLPTYYTIKSKARIPFDFRERLIRFEQNIADRLLGRSQLDRRDGMRFDFDRGWLQIRSSNTEPIFRVIVETDDAELSRSLSKSVIGLFK